MQSDASRSKSIPQPISYHLRYGLELLQAVTTRRRAGVDAIAPAVVYPEPPARRAVDPARSTRP